MSEDIKTVLTDEQIYDIADSPECNPDNSGWGAKFDVELFARAIERAVLSASASDKKDAVACAVDICIATCNSGNARKILRDTRTQIIDAAIAANAAQQKEVE